MNMPPEKYGGVEGHLHWTEGRFLYETAERIGPGKYIELGTYKGRSTCFIAGGLKDAGSGHLYTVDAFDGRGMTKNRSSSLEEVLELFKSKGLEDYITVFPTTTLDVRNIYKQQDSYEFNFLFIDAGHTYEEVKADFEIWVPYLSQDAEVAFHDSDTKGVAKFLEELSKTEWKKQGQVHSLTWWKR